MAITVGHEPVGALYELATDAGQAQFAVRQQEAMERQQLAKAQMAHERRMAEFQAKAQERARMEEMQYQVAMVMAKRQIDMQIETSNYAQQRQKLLQTLNMIKESDSFTDKEKESLQIQAMAKYSDVGTGLSSSSFDGGGGNKALQSMVATGSYRSQMAGQLQKWIDEGMDPVIAKQTAAAWNIDFTPASELKEKQFDDAAKRLENAVDSVYDAGFSTKGNKVYRYGNKVDTDSQDYRLYQTLNQQVQRNRESFEKLRTGNTTAARSQLFYSDYQSSPALQQMVQIYGPEEAMKRWELERYGSFEDRKAAEPKSGFLRNLFLKTNPLTAPLMALSDK